MGFAEYDRYDGLGLARLVARGEVSPSELLEEAIERAERVDARVHSIVVRMFEEARRRVAKDRLEGPYAGVPFLLKDLSSAYAGVKLQSGSQLYRGYFPAQHSELVERYLRAGLVVFGKTNTPELGIVPVTEPALYGPTHNPWRHGRTPGGSSGGAAAAVAAGIVPMAHGGDGGGSIRIPAACCGLFGLKPSKYRLPVGPDEPERFFGFSVEHVITRSVRDSAAMLDASVGDEPTSIYFPRPADGFLAALDAPLERPLRIAFTDEPLLPAPKNVEATRAVERAAELSEALGHHVERAHPRFDAPAFAKAFFYHFAVAVAGELKWAERHLHRPARATDVEQLTWVLGMAGRSIDGGDLVVERRVLHLEAAKIVRFFGDYDVLLTPTLGTPPIEHGALLPQGLEAKLQDVLTLADVPAILKIPGLLDRAIARAYDFAPYTPPFNVTGQPSASVPLHWTEDGLPLGSMITGRPGDEKTVLRLARQLEEAQPWFDRRPPTHA